MNCEICKIIATHGLDRSVHDLWFCADEDNGTRNSAAEQPGDVSIQLVAGGSQTADSPFASLWHRFEEFFSDEGHALFHRRRHAAA